MRVGGAASVAPPTNVLRKGQMAKTKVKEIAQVSLAAKQCTKLCCRPDDTKISHSDLWKMSVERKVPCQLKDGVEV